MITDDLVRNPGLWAVPDSSVSIVISSRVRLARNLENCAFPDWARDPERDQIRDVLRDVLAASRGMADGVYLDMETLPAADRDVLLERHLISNELVEEVKGSAVVVTPDERVSVMINEEDHLRLQAIAPGLALPTAWQTIDALDTELDQLLPYAFSPRLGYLTACPSNVGTGLRASVMMHLSGLRLTNEAEAVIKGLEKLGLAVRGLLGEGTEAYGNMFQISNQSSLGLSEDAILARMNELVGEVTRHELNARTRLLENSRTYVLDQIGRAYGVLCHARLLSSKEAVDLLSGIRLGVEMELVKGISLSEISEIMLLTQPGHLQKTAGRPIESAERDEVRAEIVKRRVEKITICG